MERFRPTLVQVPIGGHEYAPDGSRISADVVNPVEGIHTNPVDDHEGGHVYLAFRRGIGVRRAQINPDGTGVTETGGFDGVVFVGPSIKDPIGGGHDLWVAGMMGVDIEANKTVAKTMMSQGEKEIKKIAVLLNKKGSATGSEMEEAMNRGDDVLVRVKKPDGTVDEAVEENVKGEVILFPGVEMDLARAA